MYVGLAYSHAFSSATGSPPASFAVTAGSLPGGLALSADGVLPGTPTSAGTFDFTVTASNGLFADASESFSITVIDDSSPPAVTPTVTGTAGEDGWYRSDVTVSWTVEEPESLPTLQTSGCEETSLTTDTAATTLTCEATSAGGSASPSVTIKRDTQAPTVTIEAPTATTYPQGQAVAAGYDCNDGGSGVGACAGPVANGAPIDTASAAAKTFTVTASDRAGNKQPRSLQYLLRGTARSAGRSVRQPQPRQRRSRPARRHHGR